MRQGLITRRPIASFYRAALAHTQGDASSGTIDGLERAIEEFRNVNYLVRMPYYLSVLADAHARRGLLGDARNHDSSRARHAPLRRMSDGAFPRCLRIQASILTAEGRSDDAEAILLESMTVAREIGALSWRLRAANDLAKLWRVRSRADDARKMLLPIYNEFTEGFATRDLVVAADLLSAH